MGRWGDDIAIVGVGTTDFGKMYRNRDTFRTAYDLGAEAFAAAIEDAGLKKDEIDGLLCCRIPSYNRMANMLGLRHLHAVNGFEGSGRMSGVAIETAIAMIHAGLADTVACVYGNNGRSAGARYGGDPLEPTAAYDTMYGMTSPGAYVGLMYRRYQHLYNVPDGALAPLAINNRKNAARNPVAVMKDPISEEQYLRARFIAEPLRLFDYCLINDGGVAIILTRAERARDLKKPAVLLSASAATSDLTNYYTSSDFFFHACQDVAGRLYDASGVSPEDVDCVQIYDNFTPTILFSLEGFNYTPRGDAWRWIRGGRIELGGEKPINTSGGHTGESYMQGWALHVEAVRQLRGEASGRQVSDCEVVQYICASPIVSSHIMRRV